MEKFGVDKRYAREYAKVIIARLMSKVGTYTKWGFI